jgi:hypothetical protein
MALYALRQKPCDCDRGAGTRGTAPVSGRRLAAEAAVVVLASMITGWSVAATYTRSGLPTDSIDDAPRR